MNFWEYKSDCQVISRVLEKACNMEASRDCVLLEMVSLQLRSEMDVIMVSNSQTHAGRKSQPLSRASLSPRPQSWSRPLSHRCKNKSQGCELAGQQRTSGSVASWCSAAVNLCPALLLLQTAWRSSSAPTGTRPWSCL